MRVGSLNSMGLASHIITTLKDGETQSDTEIIMMIQDPVLWVANYKVGQTFRDPESNTNNSNNFALNDDDSAEATQVYIFDTSNSQYATFTDTDPGHTLTVYNYIKAISGSELVYDSPNSTTYDIANMWNPVTNEEICCGDNVDNKSLSDFRNTTEEYPVRNFYLSTASSYSGFFAGLMQYPQASNTNDPLASVRSTSTLATFTFDSTNDDVQVVVPLAISAFPSNNYTSTWGSAVDTGNLTLKFGDADNSEAHSAYISKEVFGAMLQDDGAQIDGSAGGSGNLAGVMVSYNTLDKKDSTLFPDGREMPNTAYSTWGFWSMAAVDVSPDAGSQLGAVHLGTWVAGELVDSNEIPSTGTASMSGRAAFRSSYRYNQSGTDYAVDQHETIADVAATFNWGSSGYSGNLAFTNFDASNAIVANAGFASFNVAITGTGNTYSGNSTDTLDNGWLGGASVAGALYGGSTVNESGGRVNVNLYKTGDTGTSGANDFYVAEGIYLLNCSSGTCQ